MQSSLQTLYSYWNEVRAGRLAPQRLEIEPSRIAAILSQTFMLEIAGADAFPYRLAGTRLCEMFGTELRGKNFLDGWSEEDRRVLEGRLTTVRAQGAVAHLILEGVLDAAHRFDFEAILLPLLHAGEITRIIGAMGVTSAPHWLGAEPLRNRRLKQHGLMWPDRRAHASPQRHGGPAPPLPAPSGCLIKVDRRRFRVLEGGRGGGKHDKP